MNTGPQAAGLMIGTVKEVDPKLGRVRVEIHERGHATHWAPIAALMAGDSRGTYFMPEVGDEAVVGFDRGHFDHPYVIGFLWNGQDAPPVTDGKIRMIKSVNGHEIALYDPPVASGDRGYIRVRDAHGNQIEMANGIITIKGVGILKIDAPVVSINGRVVSPVGPPI